MGNPIIPPAPGNQGLMPAMGRRPCLPQLRAVYTTVAASDNFQAGWVTTLPALGSVIGENLFTIVAGDGHALPVQRTALSPCRGL